MADSESEPLLSESAVASSSRQTAQRDSSDATDEHTPLLTSTSATARYDGVQDGRAPDDGAAAGAQQRRPSNASSTTKGRRRRIGPSLVAMILLALGVVCIIGGAFFVPAAVESYAKQAAVVEPTSLSLERLTPGGVAARIRAKFRLDSSRVQSGEEVGADVSVVRAIGRTVTGLIGSLSTRGDTVVRVFLPDYEGRPMVGLARVPPLSIGVRDGQETTLDFVAELEAGDAEGVRAVVNEWLAGRLDFIRLLGATDVSLSAAGGILPLGTHSIVESITVEGQALYQSFASLYFGEKTLL